MEYYINGAITAMDNLSYTYTGNRLDNISDGGSQTLGYKVLTGSAAVYQHDAYGSLTVDPKKGISMSYNVLSRTDRVTVTTSAGRYISYTYDAVGVLLRKQAYDNNILQKTTDYVDGFVYENGTLSHFSMAEGRIRNTGSALKAEYMIADHQGNVRVSFEEENGQAVVRQENSYYPYGMIMPGGSLPTQPNRNLYNEGSEWQNDYGDLPDYYNTFYRNYDPATGRFISIDPKAEASEELSPYHYGGNNPVMFNDPLGDLYERGILEMEISQAAEAVWGRGGGGGSGSGGFNVGNGPYANFWGQFMSQTWRQTPSDGQYHNYTWNAFAGERLSEQQWLSQGGSAGQLGTATGFVQFYSGAWVKNNASPEGTVGWKSFVEGFMKAEPSDMQSASAFLGYLGIPLAKNEALLRYALKTATNWANKANALRAVKGFAIAGKSVGGLSAGLTLMEDISKGNVGYGTAAKVSIGLLATFSGRVGLAYGIIDVGTGIYTGTTVTDRIGVGVDNFMK